MRRTADAGGISGSVRDTVGRTDQGHLRLDADTALSTLYGAESAGRMWIKLRPCFRGFAWLRA
jgi:hypothetical protein